MLGNVWFSVQGSVWVWLDLLVPWELAKISLLSSTGSRIPRIPPTGSRCAGCFFPVGNGAPGRWVHRLFGAYILPGEKAVPRKRKSATLAPFSRGPRRRRTVSRPEVSTEGGIHDIPSLFGSGVVDPKGSARRIPTHRKSEAIAARDSSRAEIIRGRSLDRTYGFNTPSDGTGTSCGG